MPNTTSAKKRLRQNEGRRARNRSIKSAVRTQIKKVRLALQAGNIADAESEFRLAARKLDKAGSQRILHPNTSSRLKSRLQHLIRKTKQTTPSA